MLANPDRTRLVERLQEAMDELCAPGLTLARADVLRPRVARILEALESPEAPARDRRAGVARAMVEG